MADDLIAPLLSLAAIAVGAAPRFFGVWVEKPKEFRGRLSLARETLLEKVNQRLVVLVRFAQSMTTDDVLRGDGRDSPDYVADFTSEQMRMFTHAHRLRTIERFLQLGHWVLLSSTATAVALLIASIAKPDWASLILYLVVLVIAVQLATIMVLYRFSRRLDEAEDLA